MDLAIMTGLSAPTSYIHHHYDDHNNEDYLPVHRKNSLDNHKSMMQEAAGQIQTKILLVLSLFLTFLLPGKFILLFHLL